ncbi:alpha/beta fold hydrolase [Nonomuraea sp. NPDC050556]|uniref:alpha/beta fold hydrolase n=1 Tax=Nonomuraea sp. NPDC050556 TaxID=3364369 RepID=UPI00379F3A57
MNTLTSYDGTTIAFERLGDGPPIVLVGESEPLATLLATRFTVYRYDRRGCGGSGNIAPYCLAREVEDLEALIELAGGRACVVALPSAAELASAAARALPCITRLVTLPS